MMVLLHGSNYFGKDSTGLVHHRTLLRTNGFHHVCNVCLFVMPVSKKREPRDFMLNIQLKICLWNPNTGKQLGKKLSGHRQWVTCLAWEPFHANAECRNLASSSKVTNCYGDLARQKDLKNEHSLPFQDGCVKIWDTKLGTCTLTLNGHMQSVTCVKWSGEGLLYTASQDRTIKVWRSDNVRYETHHCIYNVLCNFYRGRAHCVELCKVMGIG